MKNKYGFCKGLAALVLLMLCALTIKDNAYAQTAKTYKVLFINKLFFIKLSILMA